MSSTVSEYFASLSDALKAAGIAWPVLVIDGNRLEQNLDAVAALASSGKSLRLVAKSLPVPQLLRLAAKRLGTNRMMTFSVKMLEQVDALGDGYHQMLGKPVPVAAIEHLIKQGDKGKALASRTVWLADTSGRIDQYEALAARHDLVLPVALEIDVGLRRGGVFEADEVLVALEGLKSASNLTFSGLMGYEPHLPALPQWFAIQRRARQNFLDRYEAAVAMARNLFGEKRVANAILNTAGSKTIADRLLDSPANDFSLGSLLVKPTDFDKVEKPYIEPALFVATPALKRADPFAIPGLGTSALARRLFGSGARRGVYIHGGNWLADPVYPSGLFNSSVIGRSSNQELLVTKGELTVKPDDFVFLRPRQSEAIMLQFGPIAVFRDGEITDWWETFEPSA